MFVDDVLQEQVEQMKKIMLPCDTNPGKSRKRLQEINDDLEYFDSGTMKLTKKELIKDIIISRASQGRIF